MKIAMEQDAARYVLGKKSAVVIDMNFEPSIGGCACSLNKINGSYVPVISLGRPQEGVREKYHMQMVDGVEVYTATGLDVKQGFDEISIKLRGKLGFRWLEMEGAKGIACYAKS